MDIVKIKEALARGKSRDAGWNSGPSYDAERSLDESFLISQVPALLQEIDRMKKAMLEAADVLSGMNSESAQVAAEILSLAVGK